MIGFVIVSKFMSIYQGVDVKGSYLP